VDVELGDVAMLWATVEVLPLRGYPALPRGV
jgi:hypothetical protein